MATMKTIKIWTLHVTKTGCNYYTEQGTANGPAGTLTKNRRYIVIAKDGQAEGKDWCRIVRGTEHNRYYVPIVDGCTLARVTIADFVAGMVVNGEPVQETAAQAEVDTLNHKRQLVESEKATLVGNAEAMEADIVQLAAAKVTVDVETATALANAQTYNQQAEEQERMTQEAENEKKALLEKIRQLETCFGQQLAQHATSTTAKIQAVENNYTQQINQHMSAANAGFDSLHHRIDHVRNPVTGQRNPAPTVASSLFSLHREDGLTASEYKALNLTATAHRAAMLTAFDYAVSGKGMLA